MESETYTLKMADGTEREITVNPVLLKWDGQKWKVMPYADNN